LVSDGSPNPVPRVNGHRRPLGNKRRVRFAAETPGKFRAVEPGGVALKARLGGRPNPRGQVQTRTGTQRGRQTGHPEGPSVS